MRLDATPIDTTESTVQSTIQSTVQSTVQCNYVIPQEKSIVESMESMESIVQSDHGFDLEWEQWEFIVDPSTFEWEQDEEGQWWYIYSWSNNSLYVRSANVFVEVVCMFFGYIGSVIQKSHDCGRDEKVR